jgi:lysophospholipase L1-like esterase
MSASRNRIINGLMAIGSVAIVLGISLAADRVLGAFAPAAPLPGSMELIFPPHAVQNYETVDFKYAAHINMLGLREREIQPKKPGVFRICAIGDSYTYGWGVEAEQTWLRKLEEKLIAAGLQVETINLGKPGSGPPFYSELAPKALPVLEPDLVIVALLMGNDMIAAAPESAPQGPGVAVTLARTLYPNITGILQRPKVPTSQISTQMPPSIASAENNIEWTRNTAQQFLKDWPAEERARYDKVDPRVRAAFEAGRFNPYMVDLALKSPEVYNHTLNLEDPWFKGTMGAVAAHLRIIDGVAKEVGAKTVAASLPDGPYVNDVAQANIQKVGYTVPVGIVDSDAPDMAVRKAAEEAGLPFITAAAEFKKHRAEPDLYFEFDGHLSAKGHALFAEAIAPQVEALVREANGK